MSPAFKGVSLPFIILRLLHEIKQQQNIYEAKLFTHLFSYLVTEQSYWVGNLSGGGHYVK